MNVSIVVPVFNSEKTLDACLGAIRRSSAPGTELIVVDDGSTDGSVAIARKYADQVVEHGNNLGRSHARNTGVERTRGELVLFIDSDVVVRPDTVATVSEYFARHADVDALSGQLSKEHPNADFFSQYKNLYMNYIFGRLPDRVSFLYGSVHAVRRSVLVPHGPDMGVTDDTALGQQLARAGRRIAFVKEIDVVHLKKYGLWSFVKNDFRIPYDWTKIFLEYGGWRQVGRNGTGYLHSPKHQLASVALAPTAILVWPLVLVWAALNASFIGFLAKEKGRVFAALSVPVTFVDHCVMAAGIVTGFVVNTPRVVFGRAKASRPSPEPASSAKRA